MIANVYSKAPQARGRQVRSAKPAILRDESGLDDVEALMLRLARGDRIEHAGGMVAEQLQTGGKRLRARLALRATEALGGALEAAVGWAAAVELLHNATLIHDDIQDGDVVRRGKPTLWSKHGVAQAINAGDLLLMLPFLALAETPPSARAELSSALATYATQVVRGQVHELDMLPARRLDWASYDYAVTGKTGALIALPVHGAAVIAGQSPRRAAALAEAFVPLGVLFQLQDDVLDLYGDKGRQERGSDLYEGKVSGLVVAHLERCPQDERWLLGMLAAPRAETDPNQVSSAIAAFRSSGALSDVLAHIRRLEQRVERSVALARVPALRDVALDLARFALAPIRHLTSPSAQAGEIA